MGNAQISLTVPSATVPWPLFATDNRQFHRILRHALIGFAIAGLVVPFLPLPDREAVRSAPPPRFTSITIEPPKTPPAPRPVIEKKAEPLPKPAPRPQPQPKPATKPEPKPEPRATREAVRDKVSKVGLLAMADELQDLRDAPVVRNLDAPAQRVTGETPAAERAQRSLIAQRARQASGGIDTASLSRETGAAALSDRATTVITDERAARDAAASQQQLARRTDEELKLVFDRHKNSFNILYSRAQRSNPLLAGGTVVFELTIAPSGEVLDCKVLDSELNAPDLERKFLVKLRTMNFGAKDVDTVIVEYPLTFVR